MKNSATRIAIVISFLFGLLALAVPHASAVSYTIDTGNTVIGGCCTGPFATVTITPFTNSNTATITFTSLTNGGNIYLMGDGGSADLNVNGAYTLGTVTPTNGIAGFTPSFLSNTPGQVNGFGNFNLSINLNDGFTGSATTISFTLTKASGTWTSDTNVLTPNANGAIVGIHAFACDDPCSASAGAVATGFAAGSGTTVPPTDVPEPSALLLLGSGLIAMSALARSRLRHR